MKIILTEIALLLLAALFFTLVGFKLAGGAIYYTEKGFEVAACELDRKELSK